MTGQKHEAWVTVVTLSVGIVLGLGTASWITQSSPLQETKGNEETQHDRRLAQLEQAVTALTHALQLNTTKDALPETSCVASRSNEAVLRQSVAQIVREELQRALPTGGPEREQAKAEGIAVAQALNSPENRAAYQSAVGVVQAVLASGLLTDDDARTLRDARAHLIPDQLAEIMQTLAPAINRGEIIVEASGPLF
jgi:hypothetical protein